MSISEWTDTGLFELLRRCTRERDGDTPDRLAEQEAKLKDIECTDPEMGRWIDANDFPFLIETLMLSDVVFSEEYPQVRLTEEERKRFARALEDHCEVCAHCGSKRFLDLEWQSRVNGIFAENREAIGEVITRALGKG